MINTNGVRIAQDPAFVERLASYAPRLEVYLQFDSLNDEALVELRGAKLSRIRRQALEALEAVGLSTTLVVVVKRGVNDQEVGDIVRHALTWNCVRGVTFQPVQDAGRNENFDAQSNRVLLTQIRREVGKSGVFSMDDMIPLPCNPDQISIGYALREGTQVHAVDAAAAARSSSSAAPNTISYEAYPELQGQDFRPALAGDGPGEYRGEACRPAMLPAARDGPCGAELRQQLSGRDPASFSTATISIWGR